MFVPEPEKKKGIRGRKAEYSVSQYVGEGGRGRAGCCWYCYTGVSDMPLKMLSLK